MHVNRKQMSAKLTLLTKIQAFVLARHQTETRSKHQQLILEWYRLHLHKLTFLTHIYYY